MNTENDKRFESPAFLANIEMLQGIINRMASNSANCKTWTVTILCAMLAITTSAIDKLAPICYGLIGVMFLLDCFYLGLERHFKEIQNNIVNKVVAGEEFVPFKMKSTGFYDQLEGILDGMISISTTPFYLTLAFLIYLFAN